MTNADQRSLLLGLFASRPKCECCGTRFGAIGLDYILCKTAQIRVAYLLMPFEKLFATSIAKWRQNWFDEDDHDFRRDRDPPPKTARIEFLWDSDEHLWLVDEDR